MTSPSVTVRPGTASDWPWVLAHADAIGGRHVVSQGHLYDLTAHGLTIAIRSGATVGFLVRRLALPQVEILAIAAVARGGGVGTRLMAAVEAEARALGAAHLSVSITNDNLDALGFYQRRGFHVSAYNVGGFETVRRLKGLGTAEIRGATGIEIRDTITLVRAVGP